MYDKEKFRVLYGQSIEPELGDLEKKRKQVLPAAIIWRILAAAFFVLITTVFTGIILRMKNEGSSLLVFKAFAGLIIMVLLLIISSYLIKLMRKKTPERLTSAPMRIAAMLGLSTLLFSMPLLLALKLTENIHEEKDIPLGMIFKTGALVIFVGFPVLGICLWTEKKFSRMFKNKIIAQLVPFVTPGSLYDASGFVNQQKFIDSGLFPLPIEQARTTVFYKGSDHISAKTDQTEIEFSLLNINSETQSMSGAAGDSSSTTTSSKKIFKGIFLKATGPSHFKGETIIRPNNSGQRAAGKLKSAGNLIFKTDSKEVKTGDEAFDREYIVYTNEADRLKEVLNGERRTKILDVKKQWKDDLHISFIGPVLSVAISREEDDLQPSVFKSVINYEDVELQYTYLDNIFSLAKIL